MKNRNKVLLALVAGVMLQACSAQQVGRVAYSAAKLPVTATKAAASAAGGVVGGTVGGMVGGSIGSKVGSAVGRAAGSAATGL